jgi:hypothetical protein
MATFIISGSRGTDDPTMATLPLMAAKVAKEQGHEVVLWLWNEAVTLGRKGTADHVTGVNLTPLKELQIFQYGSAAPARWLVRSAGQTSLPVRRSRACLITSRLSPNGTVTWHSDSVSKEGISVWQSMANRPGNQNVERVEGMKRALTSPSRRMGVSMSMGWRPFQRWCHGKGTVTPRRAVSQPERGQTVSANRAAS